jgi:hypothetical protein
LDTKIIHVIKIKRVALRIWQEVGKYEVIGNGTNIRRITCPFIFYGELLYMRKTKRRRLRRRRIVGGNKHIEVNIDTETQLLVNQRIQVTSDIAYLIGKRNELEELGYIKLLKSDKDYESKVFDGKYMVIEHHNRGMYIIQPISIKFSFDASLKIRKTPSSKQKNKSL